MSMETDLVLVERDGLKEVLASSSIPGDEAEQLHAIRYIYTRECWVTKPAPNVESSESENM